MDEMRRIAWAAIQDLAEGRELKPGSPTDRFLLVGDIVDAWRNYARAERKLRNQIGKVYEYEFDS